MAVFFMIIRHIYDLSFERKKKFFCQKDVVRWGEPPLMRRETYMLLTVGVWLLGTL